MTKQTAAEKRVAAMHRHTELVQAMHDAISILEGPFDPSDEKPGNIQDAIDILREALKR